MRRYLCLDLATCSGFAIGGTDRDCEPVSGAVQLPRTGRDVGAFLIAFRDWLDGMIEAEKPTDLVFEAPVLSRSQLNMHTLRKLYSLAGMTEVVAISRQIRCREIQLTDIRKNTIGHTRAPKSVPKSRRSAWMKKQTMDWAKSRGWSPKTADAADALAVFHTINLFDDPSYAVDETPLFGSLS